MRRILVIFSLVSMASSAIADVSSQIQSELAVIVTASESCTSAKAYNRIIGLGEAAIEPLVEALGNSNTDLNAKWAAATILGLIGTVNTIPALSECNKTGNMWLNLICENSIKQIAGKAKRAEKVYLYTKSAQLTRFDCEAGTTEIIRN